MKTLRVLCYAINGRGLGHLTRQLAIARWMRRYAEVLGVRLELWVLTSSEADTLARREGFPALKMPSKAMLRDSGVELSRGLSIVRAWVVQSVALIQPQLLVVDTFPGGTFGELGPVLELAPQRALIARPVRARMAEDPGYAGLLPLYPTVLVPEDLASPAEPAEVGPILLREREELLPRAQARLALGVPDDQRAVWLSLGGGGDPAAAGTLPRLARALRERGWFVIIAAGPLYEGEELRGDGLVWLDRYASMELLPAADAAVSAGGYNSLHELMFAGIPTVFLPQPRVADDQEARVARVVAAGAGRLARTEEEVPELLEAPGSAEAARALVPQNGARPVAARLLALLLPEEDVARAVEVLRPELLGLAGELSSVRLVELARVFAGEPPSRYGERRAAALGFVDAGLVHGQIPSASPASASLVRLFALVRALDAPAERAADLVFGLRRSWPAASPAELLQACEQTLTVLARFQDWGGAVALLRAFPQQRTWALSAFVQELSRWLERERDLFDAQRRFVRMEAGGKRSLAECLRLLADGAGAADDEEPLL